MKEKRFCRSCRGKRNHKVLSKTKRTEPDDEEFRWYEEFYIIECSGCDTISFLKIYSDESMQAYDEYGDTYIAKDVDIYPLCLKRGNELNYQHHLPDNIKIIYKETITALKAELSILAAAGLRAIIEAICNHLKIKRGNLADRIDNLHKKGHLNLNESKRLHSVRFMGNDAIHEMETPPKENLFVLLDIVNQLLANLFINDHLMIDIDKVVDTYPEFEALLRSCISKENVGSKLSIKKLIGKKIRQVKQPNLLKFEKQLVQKIKNGETDFLSISKSNATETTYEVIKNIPKYHKYIFQ